MKVTTAAAAAALCLLPLVAQSDDAPSGGKMTGVKPIAKLAWLEGGVWTADASKMGNGMRRIETRYRWSDNDSFLRFNTHFVTGKADLKTYDGQFFWDPARATLAIWYMDATNDITQGPVTVSGDVTEVHFRGENFAGAMTDLRVQVTRKNNDLYHWSLAEKDGEDWKELGALDYARKPGS